MKISNPNDYDLIGFTKSFKPDKKYDAILKNKYTDDIKLIPFGSAHYQQYQDTTGLNLYSDYNHFDKKRRSYYRARHNGEQKNKFSSGYFSWHYLWT